MMHKSQGTAEPARNSRQGRGQGGSNTDAEAKHRKAAGSTGEEEVITQQHSHNTTEFSSRRAQQDRGAKTHKHRTTRGAGQQTTEGGGEQTHRSMKQQKAEHNRTQGRAGAQRAANTGAGAGSTVQQRSARQTCTRIRQQ